MKRNKDRSFSFLKPLVVASCLAVVSASAASGPTNSWSEWQYKKLYCGFTNALVVTINGHELPAFSTNLFDSESHVFMYGGADGKVFGVGDMSLQTTDRSAVFNVEAKGSLVTKGSKPSLSFTLTGKGSGTVGTDAGTAQLNAKFVQSQFITNAPGGSVPETYYAEGQISGTISQAHGKNLKFEETIRILLDNVPGHFADIGSGPQLRLDIVDIDGRNFAGHTHGTNNCFGRYEGDPADELFATGSYDKKNGNLVINFRGLGQLAGAINGTVTAKLDSAPSGSPIHISNATLKGKAYGQKPVWYGAGVVQKSEP